MGQIKFEEKSLNSFLFLQLPLNKKTQDTSIFTNFTKLINVNVNVFLLFSFNFSHFLITPLHSFLLTQFRNLPIRNFLNH